MGSAFEFSTHKNPRKGCYNFTTSKLYLAGLARRVMREWTGGGGEGLSPSRPLPPPSRPSSPSSFLERRAQTFARANFSSFPLPSPSSRPLFSLLPPPLLPTPSPSSPSSLPLFSPLISPLSLTLSAPSVKLCVMAWSMIMPPPWNGKGEFSVCFVRHSIRHSVRQILAELWPLTLRIFTHFSLSSQLLLHLGWNLAGMLHHKSRSAFGKIILLCSSNFGRVTVLDT